MIKEIDYFYENGSYVMLIQDDSKKNFGWTVEYTDTTGLERIDTFKNGWDARQGFEEIKKDIKEFVKRSD